MDDVLRRLIRERYPFPIAHAHKKTLSFLHDDASKLKCLIQTAEVVVQFLALVVLAQLHRDLEHGQAPELGSRATSLRDDLRNPSFGKWLGLLRAVLKQYAPQRHLLVLPELFDFYFQPSRGKTLRVQPVVSEAIEPLITLRNQAHHPGIPDDAIPGKIAAGMAWLEQMLAALQCLSAYQLAFIQRIEVAPQTQPPPRFSHELLQMGGCFTTFDRQHWESEALLQARRLILLAADATRPPLFLDPFITCAEQLRVGEEFVVAPGVFEIFLLNGTEARRARYLAAQCGQELRTDHATWEQGSVNLEALGAFYDRLRRAPMAEAEVAVEAVGQSVPAQVEGMPERSTEEVFAAQYQRSKAAKQFTSPYKFLDYFTPEDAELFYGREQEIRELQRKFHRARLLVLHGESGTGKTSLIRAGLIPHLASESYVPVYVRALEEPTQAIKEEVTRQLGVDRRHLDLPLAAFLDAETAHLSKTVVVILDQFEEFFLRFPPEARQLLHRELGACVAAAHLDVHIIIALREDYFSALAEFQRTLPDIFTHEMRLARLTQAQALEAAVAPLQHVGMSIDTTLVAEVILPQLDDAGHGIEPPLLQIVCDALYQHAQDAGRTAIGSEDYTAIGDVRGALGQYLERTLRQFGPAQPQARTVLKALVTSAGTKQAVFIDELVARVRTLGCTLTVETLAYDFLRPLVQARLVRAEEVDGRTRYELAHEYLVQQIAAWIAEHERELTRVRELVDRAYEGYRATGLLLEPRALAVIAPYEDQVVSADETEKRAFLAQSRQEVRKQRRGVLLKVGTLLLVMALGIGGVFSWRLYQSNQQLQVAKSNADASASQARHRLAEFYREQGRRELLEGRPSAAAVYLSQAHLEGDTGSILLFLLAQAMQPLDAQLASLQGHAEPVQSAAFSPDGAQVVTASRDRTAKVWDAQQGRLLASLKGHTEPVQSAAFSPDGTRVVTASKDRTAKVWDTHPETRTPAEIAALVRCHAPWQLEAGVLLQTTPDPTACPQRAPQR